MKNYMNCLLIMLAATTATAQTTTTTTTTQNQSTSITTEQFIDQAALSGMKEVATGKMAKRKAQDTKVKSFGAMMAEDHGKANTELMALAKSKNIKLPKQGDLMPASSTMDNSGNGAGSANTSNDAGTTTGSNTMGSTNQTTSATTGTTGTTTGNTNNSANTSGNNSTTHQNHSTGQTDQSRGATNMTNTADSLKMLTASDIRTAIQQLDGLTGAQFDTAYTQMMVTDHKNAITLFERAAMSSDSDIKAFATKHLPTLHSHLQQIQSISGTNTQGQQRGQGGTTGSGGTGQ